MTQPPSAPAISVRFATEDDLPVLSAKESEAAKGNAARNLELQAQGDYFLVVGLVNGEIGGNVVLDCRTGNELRPEMKNLWVYPDARRQGLGAAMTSFMEEKAAGLGFTEIFLGVTPDNPAAIPMYIGLDYTPTGEHRNAANLAVLELDGDQIINDGPTEAIYRKSLLIRR